MLVQITREDIDRSIPCHPTMSAVAFALRRVLGISPESADHIFIAGHALCYSGGIQTLPESLYFWMCSYNRGESVQPFAFEFEPQDRLRSKTRTLIAA